jgi:hypothetical protein
MAHTPNQRRCANGRALSDSCSPSARVPGSRVLGRRFSSLRAGRRKRRRRRPPRLTPAPPRRPAAPASRARRCRGRRR